MITADISSELYNKKGSELVKEYNVLAQKVGLPQVTKFSSRSVGVKRILCLLADHPEVQVVPVNPEPPKKVEAKRRRSTGGRPFDLPSRSFKRNYRPHSGRGRLVAVLREGRTFEALLFEFPQWDSGQLMKHIRVLHLWLGYGLKETDGIITLHD